jgi:hypothetical protein
MERVKQGHTSVRTPDWLFRCLFDGAIPEQSVSYTFVKDSRPIKFALSSFSTAESLGLLQLILVCRSQAFIVDAQTGLRHRRMEVL